MEDGTDSGKRSLSLRDLFVLVTLVAVASALLFQYCRVANNTVDERTIPLMNLSFARQAYFYGGVVACFASCVLVFSRLAVLGKRRLAAAFAIVFGVGVLAAIPLVVTKVVEPVRGNPVAELHNDATALTALAVLRYFERTERWPASWDDLDGDVAAIVAESQKVATSSGVATSLGTDPFSQDETSQSLWGRNVDISGLSADRLSRLVDIDFTADPELLANKEWSQFDAIRPHKPSYNTYRVEFKQLIDRLASCQNVKSQPAAIK